MTDHQSTKSHIQAQFEVPLELCGTRIDQVLAKLLPDFSRERLKEWLIGGQITVNGKRWKPKNKVIGEEQIVIDVEFDSQGEWIPESIELDVQYEDDHVIIVNKPAGLVVHPGHGNFSGTLLNALIAKYPELISIPRAGIVHRLDKQTSGLLAVARSLKAQKSLVNQLRDRLMTRQYCALVFGNPKLEGTIDAPIDRHRVLRTKMAVVADGKPSITHYRVLESTAHCSWLQVSLETGRTHQIRVHLTHIGHPLVGDPVYRKGRCDTSNTETVAKRALENFPRQALHAETLGLIHPGTGDFFQCKVSMPNDLVELKNKLNVYDV